MAIMICTWNLCKVWCCWRHVHLFPSTYLLQIRSTSNFHVKKIAVDTEDKHVRTVFSKLFRKELMYYM